MLSERKEKDLSPKFTLLSLAEIVEDQLVAIRPVCTCCHKQNLSSKIQAFTKQKLPDMLPLTTQKLPDMLPLSSRICQRMRQFFVKRAKFLAATSNLRVEQNLVRFGRFLDFNLAKKWLE